ncbi:MAG: tRNA (adenosine(37)-N6)-threonylcarbamoyltransferase complex ATPase subunit type 1 TsaE [Candidatus Omnitrophota bacterium]
MKIISNSIEETSMIGTRLAAKLKKGDVVALIGQLGAGKTVLTKGIAKGLGVKDVQYVNSPTFVIIKEYEGKMPLYHFDLYRLSGPGSLDEICYDEYFYGDGVSVVEWADKIKSILPKKRLEVRLSVAGENKRKIEIKKLS